MERLRRRPTTEMVSRSTAQSCVVARNRMRHRAPVFRRLLLQQASLAGSALPAATAFALSDVAAAALCTRRGSVVRPVSRPCRGGDSDHFARCLGLPDPRPRPSSSGAGAFLDAGHESSGVVPAVVATTATRSSHHGHDLVEVVSAPVRRGATTLLIRCHDLFDPVPKTGTPYRVESSALTASNSGPRIPGRRGSTDRSLWIDKPVTPRRDPGRRGFNSRSRWFADQLTCRAIPVAVDRIPGRRGLSPTWRAANSRSLRIERPVAVDRDPGRTGTARR